MSLLSNAVRRLRTEISGSKNAKSMVGRLMARFGSGSTSDLPNFMNKIGAYRLDLREPLVVARFGSSVENAAGQSDANLAPGAYFTRRIKQLFDPADRFNISEVNYAANGSTISGFADAWAAMQAAGVKPIIVHMAYGMNDWQPAQFNSGQTFKGFGETLEEAVNLARNDGADVILYTTPHASIVNHGAELYTMPPGIPQTYPVDQNTPEKPAPVLPEQMTPPASQSSKSVDYLGDGIMVTLDVRTLSINDAIRAVGRRLGVLVIEADKCYIEALQEATDRLGSPALAEAQFYAPTERVHPNDTGIGVSYHRAIEEFLLSFCHQLSQRVVEKTGEYGGMNMQGARQAVWDITPPRGDTNTSPMKVWANNGKVATDGDGLNAREKWLELDKSGDLVHGRDAHRWRAPVDFDYNIVIENEVIDRAYGVCRRQKIQGGPNTMVATPWTTSALPDNSAGTMVTSAQNAGVGIGYQVNYYRWKTKAGVLTLAADGANMGSGQFTVAVSGLRLVVTVTADNTYLQCKWDSLASD